MVANPKWYAIHARSNLEKKIAVELDGKGIESYLPAQEETHQWKDRKRKVAVPLFAGYLFARFRDTPELRLNVLKTSGVIRILGQGSAIEPVPEGEIEAVKTVLNSRVSCSAHGLIRMGTQVRVRHGPLAGLEGLLARIKRQERLVISVGLLGQSVAAEVSLYDVEPLCIRI